MTAPEFSRPRRLDRIGGSDSNVSIAAGDDERAALAERFGLIALERLEANCVVRRDGDSVFAEGRLRAAVAQPCIASGAAVPAAIDEAFSLRFLPAGSVTEEELELAEGECDTIFFDGGVVDLGEAVAQTLALALDPFPRSAEADAVLREAGILSDEDDAESDGPLAAVLRDKLTGE